MFGCVLKLKNLFQSLSAMVWHATVCTSCKRAFLDDHSTKVDIGKSNKVFMFSRLISKRHLGINWCKVTYTAQCSGSKKFWMITISQHKELDGSILDRQKSFGNLTKHLMFYLRAFKHSWTQMSFSTCMIYEAWLILFFCTDLPWFFFTGVLYKLTCEDLVVIRNQTWACSPSADLNRIEILCVLKMFPGL